MRNFLILLALVATTLTSAYAGTDRSLYRDLYRDLARDLGRTFDVGASLNGNERIVAKGGAIPLAAGAAPSNHLRSEGRYLVTFGNKDVATFGADFWNGYVDINGQEQCGPNPITIGPVALERVTGTAEYRQLYFGGTNTTIVVPPCGRAATAKIAANKFTSLSKFDAGSKWRLRINTTVATAGQGWPTTFDGGVNKGPIEQVASERQCAVSSAATSQVLGTGNISVPSGGVDSKYCFGPTVMFGEWLGDAGQSVVLFGDSVAYVQDDAQDTSLTGGGFMTRCMRDVSGGPYASVMAARGSAKAQYWPSGNTYRKRLFGFATTMLDNIGGSDALGGATVSNLVNYKKAIWSDFRAHAKGGRYISHVSLQPATNSASGNWTSAGDQTAIANAGVGQARDQYNDAILALVGAADGPSQYLNTNLDWEDQSNLSKWVSNGTNDYATSDGRHPSSAMHVAAASRCATAAATWPVSGAQTGEALFVAAGTMAGAGTVLHPGDATFTATALMAAAGETNGTSEALFTASGLMDAQAGVTRNGDAAFTGSGLMVADAGVIRNGAAAFTASGLMAADGSTGGSFTPASISGLTVWYDPSDTSSITGSPASQINDKSGNSLHATQSTSGNRPATGTRTINSLNALDCDGSNDSMTATWGTGLVNDTDGATFIVVFQPDTVTVAQQYLWSGRQAGGAIAGSGIGYTGPSTYQFQGASGNGVASLNSSTTTDAHIGVYRRGRTGLGSTEVIYDGTVATGTTSTNYASTAWDLCRDNFANNKFYNGLIGEVIVYNTGISNSDMNQVGNYLETKWGITYTDIP